MKIRTTIITLLVAAAALAVQVSAQSPATATANPPAAAKPLDIAQFTRDGKLLKPADLTDWIFLGTSLGMGYNPGSFNAARPGQFQVALIEPNAYRYFVKNRSFAPGSMLLLSFYDAETQPRSINQNGFTQAELTNFEIHLIDPARGADGRAFFVFAADGTEGNLLPPDNACVRCHNKHGAFQGTFAQFYPTIRSLIPKEALARALANHDIR
jgi:cytochrome c553